MPTPVRREPTFQTADVITPPLPHATTLAIASRAGEIVGHVCCCQGTAPGVAQEQRWALYRGPALPGGATFRVPVDGPYRSCTALDTWRKLILAAPWQAETWWYVKVN